MDLKWLYSPSGPRCRRRRARSSRCHRTACDFQPISVLAVRQIQRFHAVGCDLDRLRVDSEHGSLP
jgi:hypothetical protein